MMSQCVLPNWKERQQRQEEQVEGGEEENRSSHVHSKQIDPNHNHTVPMSNYEVAELTWENGQLAMHGLGGLPPTAPTNPKWGWAGETLESIVHQATYPKQNPPMVPRHDKNPTNMSSVAATSAGKWAETSECTRVGLSKRFRSESDNFGRNLSHGSIVDREDQSACASASACATFCKENDHTTMMTWASFESPPSLKTKTTDEDSACHDGSENVEDQEREDQERETKGETGRTHSTSRRSRTASVHNQSERRRRDRINQKMKALQKLVPNASKTDKASMLDEVIEYLKHLQAQVHLMSSARNMAPQMMMPLGMQQQIQMALLARMGMGVGLGMGMGVGFDMSTAARPPPLSSPLIHPASVAAATAASSTFGPLQFVMPPPMIPGQRQGHGYHHDAAAAMDGSFPFSNPYCTFLGQPMNMDLYNKMAAICQQQVNQTAQPTSSPLPSSHA